MSERIAEVVKVYPITHSNADSLELVMVEGWQCVTRKGDFNQGDLGVFIRPDEIVKTSRPEFAFMASRGERVRIKSCRLRGEISQGLLIKAPAGSVEGDNLYETLELEHYEPELSCSLGLTKNVRTPSTMSHVGKYDIENARSSKYCNLFISGEPIWVSEKLHGANTSFVFTEDKMYAHSRTQWPEDGDNIFWRALRATPQAEKFCRDNQNLVIYGETYGQVQKGFHYDCRPGEVKFRAFDILQTNGQYMCVERFLETCAKYEIPTVPNLGIMPFDYDILIEMSQDKCSFGGKVREGIVFRPTVERYDLRLGRVICKLVNPAYLEKN